jgi:hypothetical protein
MARCSCGQSTALTWQPRCLHAQAQGGLYSPRDRSWTIRHDERAADEMPRSLQNHRFVPEGRKRVATGEARASRAQPVESVRSFFLPRMGQRKKIIASASPTEGRDQMSPNDTPTSRTARINGSSAVTSRCRPAAKSSATSVSLLSCSATMRSRAPESTTCNA